MLMSKTAVCMLSVFIVKNKLSVCFHEYHFACTPAVNGLSSFSTSLSALFFSGRTYNKQKFPNQGLNTCHCCDLSHSRDNTRSLTFCTTSEFPGDFYFWCFEEPPYCLPSNLHHFTFPPAMHKCCNFSASSPTLVIFCFFKTKFYFIF